jgi:hypothetical protein
MNVNMKFLFLSKWIMDSAYMAFLSAKMDFENFDSAKMVLPD